MTKEAASNRASLFGPPLRRTTSRLALSLWLTLALVVVEFAAGLIANSLALLTDAAHNLTDVMALGLSWYAVRLTVRPSNAEKTYGYHRAGILAALVNSSTLAVIAVGVFYGAYKRLLAPPLIRADILIDVGLVAVAVNLLTALLLRRGSESDLNLRSAFVHLMGDVAATTGAVIAGVVILFTKANWLDPVVSILIGFLILYNAWGILRETVEILLESSPRDVDMRAMVREMLEIDGVLGVHDLHVWSLTKALRSMSAHILIEDVPVSTGARVQRDISALLEQRYQIAHATLQLECVDCDAEGMYCDINGVMHQVQSN
jgi:cobalt-zinc-cadmium efflux system protein